MKVHLNTWRFGQDTTLVYHGSGYAYDKYNAVLSIIRPIVQLADDDTESLSGYRSTVGVVQEITITSGDSFTVVDCDGSDCTLGSHANITIYPYYPSGPGPTPSTPS
jgi:hypothetical protein